MVLCVASWADQLLPALGIDWQITLSQEQVCYFATPNIREFTPDRFPMWIWHGDKLFYGFPIYGEVAVKVARDVTGRWVTQETRSHEPLAEETALLADFLRHHLPGAVGPELVSKTCVYDMPADRDFILDQLPGHPQHHDRHGRRARRQVRQPGRRDPRRHHLWRDDSSIRSRRSAPIVRR